MGRWSTACALAAVLLSACSSTDGESSLTPQRRAGSVAPIDPSSPGSAGTSIGATTLVTTSVTTPSSPAMPDVDQEVLDRLPPRPEPQDCVGPIGERFDVPFALVAAHVAVGARRVVDRGGGTRHVERALSLSGVEPIRTEPGYTTPAELTLHVVEARVTGDEVESTSVLDFAALDGATDVLVLGALGPHDGGLEDLNVFLAVARADSGAEAGSCTGPIEDAAAELAGLLREQGFGGDVYEFARYWAGAGPTERIELAETLSPTGWAHEDPRLRSIRVDDVPAERVGELDVRGAYVDLAIDAARPSTIVFATDDGIGLAVGVGSDPAVLPLYFFPRTAGEIRVLNADPSSLIDPAALGASTVLGTVDAGELHAAGGIRVDGTVDDPSVTVMSREEVMAAMGRELADFELLRRQYLTPTS